MTFTTEPLLQIPPIHWQLTQLECPTFLMSGGWQPQPGSRYPGCHAVLYTCHQHPGEGIQLPVNKMHVSMCTTICVYQYKQPYSQALTCESEQKRQVHSVCASVCQFSMVLMYLCIKLSTLATFRATGELQSKIHSHAGPTIVYSRGARAHHSLQQRGESPS